MGKINTEWHKKNKMPKNPKLEGKIKIVSWTWMKPIDIGCIKILLIGGF